MKYLKNTGKEPCVYNKDTNKQGKVYWVGCRRGWYYKNEKENASK